MKSIEILGSVQWKLRHGNGRLLLAILAAGVCAAWGLLLASTEAAAAPSPPFRQCPEIGADKGCGTLVVVNADRSVSVFSDPSTGPYDGGDDTLVGFENQSSQPVSAITAYGQSGSDLFGFDGDGICSSGYRGWKGSECPYGPTEYEGPGTSFVTDPSTSDDGEIDFSPGNGGPGDQTFFSLEGAVTAATLSVRLGHLVDCTTASSSTKPTLHVMVEGANTSDTASGTGWTPGEQVNMYVDTAAGAHYIGTATTDSEGSFSSTALAAFADLLPSQAGELQAAPNEAFPIVAMGSSCDAATVTSLTESTTNGSPLESKEHTSNPACSASGIPLSLHAPNGPPPVLPLRTDGRWIVDSSNGSPPTRVKLTSVNWYGAEEADFVPGGLQCQSIKTIAQEIEEMGFNSVRLPWSNAMYEQDPSACTPQDLGTETACIPPELLAANPQLLKKSALEILQAVVAALAENHVMVILDDHSTDATFTPTPFDGVWWGGQFWDERYRYEEQIEARTEQWISDWIGMVSMFKAQRDVIGADLRNEPTETQYCTHIAFVKFGCISPQWGAGDAPGKGNWRAAAQEAGNAILATNEELLIFVEGVNYSLDLTGVHDHPVELHVAHRVVYSPHSYPGDFTKHISYLPLQAQLGTKWGYILIQDRSWTAPIWVGEFGATAGQITSQATLGGNCGNYHVSVDDAWFSCFSRYLANADIDWAWWAVNGTMSDAGPFEAPRTFYRTESYGIFDSSWGEQSSLPLIEELQNLEEITQRPTQ